MQMNGQKQIDDFLFTDHFRVIKPRKEDADQRVTLQNEILRKTNNFADLRMTKAK